jgi:hypothetical protein
VVVISKALVAGIKKDKVSIRHFKDPHAAALTGILEVMQSCGENLHWAGHVQEIELGVQHHKHVNGLIRHCGGLVCTHRDGIG